jgi:hypothetical protein
LKGVPFFVAAPVTAGPSAALYPQITLNIRIRTGYHRVMEKQNQIKSTLTRPKSIELIQARLDNVATMGRTRFAEEICEHFNFIDPAGNKQTAGG